MSFLSFPGWVFLRHARRLTMVFGALLAPLAARAQDYVEINGHLAHPTRLIALQKPSAESSPAESASPVEAVSLAAATAPGASRPAPHLVPRLVVLDEPAPLALASAGATGVTDPAEKAAALSDRLAERIRALEASGRYVYVEPDYIVSTQATPDDAALAAGELWGLRNTGQSGGTAGVDIDAQRAWDLSTGSAEVLVAVIDGGIRYTHQDLAARMWRNPGESGDGRETNGRDDDGDGYIDNVFGINAITGSGDPMDDRGHGTHVAGTIGAAANNGSSHVGVAWDVRLMALKFTRRSDGTGSISDAIECINFAVAKGARILNNSWGGAPFSNALRDAIAAARDAGALFVASAGNDGRNTDVTPQYPSGYDLDNIISVAAIDRTGTLAYFSNFGVGSVDVAAPGVDIYSTGTDYTTGFGTNADTAYRTISGTSMAAPHVTGVAALLLAREPGLTYTQLRERILAGSTPLAGAGGRVATGARLDAYQALRGEADGTPELRLLAPAPRLRRNSDVTVRVRLTDYDPLPGATVRAALGGGTEIALRDDGAGEDLVADDAIYTGTLRSPATGATTTLNVRAVAAGGDEIAAAYSYGFTTVNDYFADAVIETGSSFNSTFGISDAGREPDEPELTGNNTLWWSWTAPASGSYRLDTILSDLVLDTVLVVYTGDSLTALTLVDSDDDSGGSLKSQLDLVATAGVTYRIVVGTVSPATFGLVRLRLAARPPDNDNFAAASTLSGLAWTVDTNNYSATAETGEPRHARLNAARTVWWRWTPTVSGRATITTAGSDLDTVLAVYTGSTLATLASVAANDDATPGQRTSRVQFDATAGTIYRIVVGAFGTDSGRVRLDLETSNVIAPAFTTNPTSRVSEPGALVTFTTAATGALEWRWQRSADGGATWQDLSDGFYQGSATPTLSFTPTDASLNDSRFRARATNPGGTTASAAATLTLLVEEEEGFAGFLGDYFTLAELSDPALAGPLADPDADGLANLLEYALGGHPREADAAAVAPEVLTTEDGRLTLRHLRRTNAADLSYVVEYQTDLTAPWLTGPDHVAEIAVEPAGAGWERVTVRAKAANEPRQFLRLRVTTP